MRNIRIILIVLATSVVSAVPFQAQEPEELLRHQETLNSEYVLARAPSFYFVLDVPGKKLELRVRGMVLRSWPLRSMRFWGKPSFQGNVELKRKSALKAPERIIVRPAAGDEAASSTTEGGTAEFDVEALELKDMPESFGLDFDNGFHVSVRSSKAASGGPFRILWTSWKWNIGLPIRSFLSRGNKGSTAWLELIFEEKRDAQAIYWHFFEGINGLIL